jgi:TolB protein
LVAFVTRDASSRLRIATLELASGIINVLTDGPRDDSPSFSPNGRSILFESKVAGKGSLGSVSVDGRIKQRLTSQNGDVREPAWGPYPQAAAVAR